MAIWILEGRIEGCGGACMYDAQRGSVFGPLCDSFEEATALRDACLRHGDPRQMTDLRLRQMLEEVREEVRRG